MLSTVMLSTKKTEYTMQIDMRTITLLTQAFYKTDDI